MEKKTVETVGWEHVLKVYLLPTFSFEISALSPVAEDVYQAIIYLSFSGSAQWYIRQRCVNIMVSLLTYGWDKDVYTETRVSNPRAFQRGRKHEVINFPLAADIMGDIGV